MLPVRIAREEKNDLIANLEDYLEAELSERIGNLATEGIFDFVTQLVAPYIYNQGIQDARKLIQEQNDRTEDELSSLERPLPRRR